MRKMSDGLGSEVHKISLKEIAGYEDDDPKDEDVNSILTEICKHANRLGFEGRVITEVTAEVPWNITIHTQRFTGDLLKQIQDSI